MTASANVLLPAAIPAPTEQQRTFIRYFTAVLIDLVVLNLFAEYSDKVFVDTFTTSLLAALVLQILLKLTIWAEHTVADFFNARPGGFNRFMRFFGAWVVLFGSKLVILQAIVFFFGDKVRFEGRFHGIITLIIVVVVMLIAEELVVRLYRRLGRRTTEAKGLPETA